MKVADLQIQKNVYPLKPDRVSHPGKTTVKVLQGKTGTEKPFSTVLDDKIGERQFLRFSAHAMRRLDERQIHLTQKDLSRLEGGVKNVEEKGSKSSLILVDDMAYIVSVRNKTIVTALAKEAAQNNVFTNIDSVAIV